MQADPATAATFDPADLTLDEMRPLLAAALPAHVPFDGWSEKAVDAAARDLGINPLAARLAFPGGAMDMIEAWLAHTDVQMAAALATPDFQSRKIRERVTLAVRTRLEQAEPHKEAVRRAVAILSAPMNSVRAAKRAWQTADAIWRAVGDTATDFNHYTKRATLSSIYTATLLYWLNDESEGYADTLAFLDRRIENIMQFERVKASLRNPKRSDERLSLSRFLGRLRYPAI